MLHSSSRQVSTLCRFHVPIPFLCGTSVTFLIPHIGYMYHSPTFVPGKSESFFLSRCERKETPREIFSPFASWHSVQNPSYFIAETSLLFSSTFLIYSITTISPLTSSVRFFFHEVNWNLLTCFLSLLLCLCWCCVVKLSLRRIIGRR